MSFLDGATQSHSVSVDRGIRLPMGALYQFTCGKCGYTAEASGGQDRGMRIEVQTVSCAECKALVDVVVRQDADAVPKPRAARPVCPENRKHRVTRWTDGDPCPRCGEPMPPGVSIALWD